MWEGDGKQVTGALLQGVIKSQAQVFVYTTTTDNSITYPCTFM